MIFVVCVLSVLTRVANTWHDCRFVVVQKRRREREKRKNETHYLYNLLNTQHAVYNSDPSRKKSILFSRGER